jgi:DNA-binding MarR family transcriptional regulator
LYVSTVIILKDFVTVSELQISAIAKRCARDLIGASKLPISNSRGEGQLKMKADDNEIGLSSAIHLLHRAGQCADELFALNVGDAELTPRQFAVLRAIADSEEPSQTTLVEKTGIDRSTMADIVRRLNSKGLLQRRRTRRDARMYAVRLTDRGIAALKLAEPAARSTDERILASLAPTQREAFLRSLSRIVAAIGVPGGGSGGRGSRG